MAALDHGLLPLLYALAFLQRHGEITLILFDLCLKGDKLIFGKISVAGFLDILKAILRQSSVEFSLRVVFSPRTNSASVLQLQQAQSAGLLLLFIFARKRL